MPAGGGLDKKLVKPMEQLAAVSYVTMSGSLQFVSVPDMKQNQGDSYCNGLIQPAHNWAYPPYDEGYDASRGYSRNEWNEGDYGCEETDSCRPRRRGGRRRKNKGTIQSVGSFTDVTTPSASPAKVGLQDEFGSPDHSEATLEMLKMASSEEDCAAIMARLDSKETRDETIGWVLEAAVPLALSKGGTVIVQKAFDVAGPLSCSLLLDELAPKAIELYESPHGNWCLCKAVMVLPAKWMSKIVETLQERSFEEVSKHKFGCRLMERLIEHLEPSQTAVIAEEIIPKADVLSKHQYGNFVVQHLYEHAPNQRDKILSKILGQVPSMATHRTASHVVQRALTYSDERGQAMIVQALLHGHGENSLVKVATGRYGSFVVEQLGQLPNWDLIVKARLEAELLELVSSAFGRRVAENFEIELPEEWRDSAASESSTGQWPGANDER